MTNAEARAVAPMRPPIGADGKEAIPSPVLGVNGGRVNPPFWARELSHDFLRHPQNLSFSRNKHNETHVVTLHKPLNKRYLLLNPRESGLWHLFPHWLLTSLKNPHDDRTRVERCRGSRQRGATRRRQPSQADSYHRLVRHNIPQPDLTRHGLRWHAVMPWPWTELQ